MRTINVVVCCDKNFVQHVSVTLVSLFETNRNESFHVHVITTAERQAFEKLFLSCRPYQCKIEILRVDPDILNGLPVSHHISEAAYLRLLMGEAIKSDIRRLLYLDGDIVVNGRISELWEIDLADNIIAAVPDEAFTFHTKLGIPQNQKYFNSGVLLVDLERWRREDVGRRALEFALKNPDRITWWDQCALNVILAKRWLPLDRRWNLQTHALGERTTTGVVCNEEGIARLRDAIIVHFTTDAKPWQYMTDHPKKNLYWHYLKKTPWRNYRPPDLYPHNVIRKLLGQYTPVLLPLYMKIRRFV